MTQGSDAVKKATYVIVTVLMTVPVAAFAQHKGSLEDQMACTPDVYRLCSQNIPDEDAITACLQQHKPQLSTACKTVFSRPQAPPSKDSDDD